MQNIISTCIQNSYYRTILPSFFSYSLQCLVCIDHFPHVIVGPATYQVFSSHLLGFGRHDGQHWSSFNILSVVADASAWSFPDTIVQGNGNYPFSSGRKLLFMFSSKLLLHKHTVLLSQNVQARVRKRQVSNPFLLPGTDRAAALPFPSPEMSLCLQLPQRGLS